MIISTIIIHSLLCQMQHNTWPGHIFSASLIAPRFTTIFRCQTNGQWKSFHSILLVKLLPTKDLNKALADLSLLLQASCVSTLTQLSILTNVLKMWMILELHSTLLRILPGIYRQISKAFTKQDWNWQLKLTFWSQTGWIPRQNHLIGKSNTTNS